jgi:hypothetical protein
MQTHPNRFTQLVLTGVGLGLLVFAILLNHYHPRNAGVASASHNSISVVALEVRQLAVRSGSGIIATGSLPTIKESGQPVATIAISSPDKTPSTRITEAMADTSGQVEDTCAKLDSQESQQSPELYQKIYHADQSNFKLNHGCQLALPESAPQDR